MNEQSGNSGQLLEALNWYEHMAKQMQRATLQTDSQVMLYLMKELALDGGNRARRAIEAMPENDDSKRVDWIAMYGSYGADSSTGIPGGNGQKRVAATRKNIDAGMAMTMTANAQDKPPAESGSA